jgi:hypothetical protein
MKYFKTLWFSAIDPAIEGMHPFCLPMQTCPVCGNYRGYSGICYPSYDPHVSLKRWTKRLRAGRSQDFTWEEFVAVREEIRKDIKAFPLPPAASFGKFEGKRFKKPEAKDFVMPTATILLARRTTVEKLQSRGHRFTVETVWIKSTEPDEFVEIWAPPVGHLSKKADAKWCDVCERAFPVDLEIVADLPSVQNVSVFKLADRPSFLVLSDQFVQDVAALGLSGLQWQAIPAEAE